MPSVILAPIKITTVTGTATFGDVLQITPKSTSKVNHGAASAITGDFTANFSFVSFTNIFDADVNDANNQGNN